MDPLTAIGLVSSLLKLHEYSVKILKTFYRIFTGAVNGEIKKVIQELPALIATLETFQASVRKLQIEQDDRLKIIVQSVGESITVLEDFQDKFGNATNRFRAEAKRSSLIKFQKAIKKSIENLQITGNLLQFAFAAGTNDVVNSVRADQVEEGIRNWLQAPDPTIDYNTTIEKKTENTGDWLVRHPKFQAWQRGENSFLRMNGLPGCGKSVLTSKVVEYLLNRRDVTARTSIGVLFYYFTISEASKRDASGLLRSLLLQLSSQTKDGYALLQGVYQTFKGRGSDAPRQPQLFELKEAVKKILEQSPHHIYIILDAVDESDQRGRRETVLDTLVEIRSWRISKLHLFVSGRYEAEMHVKLRPGPNEELRISAEDAQNDIRVSIDRRLEEINFKALAPYFAEIKNRLNEGAHGNFRWVECQLKELQTCCFQRDIEEKLAALPNGLDETYERMLERLDQQQAKNAKSLLHWLCCSERLMSVVELSAYLGYERGFPLIDKEDSLNRTCPGLISIEGGPASSTRLVRIAHSSLQQYLESDRIRQAKKVAHFHFNRRRANTHVAKVCLRQLILAPTAPDNTPLASYAARSWHRHFLDGDENELTPAAHEFFKSGPAVTAWVKIVYPEDGRVEELGRAACVIHHVSRLGMSRLLEQMLRAEPPLKEAINKIHHRHSALSVATSEGHDSVVEVLLKSGANVDGAEGSYCPLSMAISGGHASIIKCLLRHNANINPKDIRGRSPLEVAIKYHDKDMVGSLLDRLGRLGLSRDEVLRHLEKASALDGVEVLQLFLKRYAIDDQMLADALVVAAAWGANKVIQALFDKGVDVNQESGDGGTALFQACFYGHDGVVEMLLERGAHVNVRKRGRYGTPLDVARQKGHSKIVQLLEGAGERNRAQQPHLRRHFDRAGVTSTQKGRIEYGEVGQRGRAGARPSVDVDSKPRRAASSSRVETGRQIQLREQAEQQQEQQRRQQQQRQQGQQQPEQQQERSSTTSSESATGAQILSALALSTVTGPLPTARKKGDWSGSPASRTRTAYSPLGNSPIRGIGYHRGETRPSSLESRRRSGGSPPNRNRLS